MMNRGRWLMVLLSGVTLMFSLWALQTGRMAGQAATEAQERAQALAAAQAPATLAAAQANPVDIRRDPTDVPGPISRRTAEHLVVNMETVEVEGQVQEGATMTYWTFDGKVPGPMIRARVGDTVEIRLKNPAGSQNVHSIDLHAVNGPGGGAVSTQVAPGEEKSFNFKALNPGLYVYHCASPHIPTHIALGMYGLILIEPEEGLPPVDREFYLMQGELYTTGHPGQKGHHDYDGKALLQEQPNFVVFNGAYQALSGEMAMQVKTGERIRLFVGNGGPNLISSLHVIGEIFDTVHREAGSELDHHVQTTLVPSGGATLVEFTIQVPGNYMLVDHSISRAINKGAIAMIHAEGPPAPEIYDGKVEPGSGH